MDLARPSLTCSELRDVAVIVLNLAGYTIQHAPQAFASDNSEACSK